MMEIKPERFGTMYYYRGCVIKVMRHVLGYWQGFYSVGEDASKERYGTKTVSNKNTKQEAIDALCVQVDELIATATDPEGGK